MGLRKASHLQTITLHLEGMSGWGKLNGRPTAILERLQIPYQPQLQDLFNEYIEVLSSHFKRIMMEKFIGYNGTRFSKQDLLSRLVSNSFNYVLSRSFRAKLRNFRYWVCFFCILKHQYCRQGSVVLFSNFAFSKYWARILCNFWWCAVVLLFGLLLFNCPN